MGRVRHDGARHPGKWQHSGVRVCVLAHPAPWSASHSLRVCRYVCLLSPLLTMVFLLLLSGLPTAEGAEQAKYMRTPA